MENDHALLLALITISPSMDSDSDHQIWSKASSSSRILLPFDPTLMRSTLLKLSSLIDRSGLHWFLLAMYRLSLLRNGLPLSLPLCRLMAYISYKSFI